MPTVYVRPRRDRLAIEAAIHRASLAGVPDAMLTQDERDATGQCAVIVVDDMDGFLDSAQAIGDVIRALVAAKHRAASPSAVRSA